MSFVRSEQPVAIKPHHSHGHEMSTPYALDHSIDQKRLTGPQPLIASLQQHCLSFTIRRLY